MPSTLRGSQRLCTNFFLLLLVLPLYVSQQQCAAEDGVCKSASLETSKSSRETSAAVEAPENSESKTAVAGEAAGEAASNAREEEPEKVWSTSALMKQCLSQVDDIHTCNSLVQDYLRKEKLKADIAAAQKESSSQEKADSRRGGGAGGGGGGGGAGAKARGGGAEHKPREDSPQFEVVGSGILYLQGTWWHFSSAPPPAPSSSSSSSSSAAAELGPSVRVMQRGEDGAWGSSSLALQLPANFSLSPSSPPPLLLHPTVVPAPNGNGFAMWFVLHLPSSSSSPPSSSPPPSCILGRALASEPAGPYLFKGAVDLGRAPASRDQSEAPRDHTEGPRDQGGRGLVEGICTDLHAVSDGGGAQGGAVFLLSNFAALPTEGGEEEEEGEQRAGGRPKLLALDWEGLEVEAVVGFQGAQGLGVHVIRDKGLWHLFTLKTRRPLAALSLSDVHDADALWSSAGLHPLAVWAPAGQPSHVKVFRKDGHPRLSVSVLINFKVACALLLYEGGKVALRCGEAQELMPLPGPQPEEPPQL